MRDPACLVIRTPFQSLSPERPILCLIRKIEEALFVGYRVRLFVLLLATALLVPIAVTAQEATPSARSLRHSATGSSPSTRTTAVPSREGLAYVDGVLYEGTGLYGESTLRRVELETGEVLQAVGLSKEYFGEGIAVLGDRIYQLTWKSGICVVFDRETFELQEALHLSD